MLKKAVLFLTFNYLQEMNSSVYEKCQDMRGSASMIESAIQDIMIILSSSRISSAEHQQGSFFMATLHSCVAKHCQSKPCILYFLLNRGCGVGFETILCYVVIPRKGKRMMTSSTHRTGEELIV